MKLEEGVCREKEEGERGDKSLRIWGRGFLLEGYYFLTGLIFFKIYIIYYFKLIFNPIFLLST